MATSSSYEENQKKKWRELGKTILIVLGCAAAALGFLLLGDLLSDWFDAQFPFVIGAIIAIGFAWAALVHMFAILGQLQEL